MKLIFLNTMLYSNLYGLENSFGGKAYHGIPILRLDVILSGIVKITVF